MSELRERARRWADEAERHPYRGYHGKHPDGDNLATFLRDLCEENERLERALQEAESCQEGKEEIRRILRAALGEKP